MTQTPDLSVADALYAGDPAEFVAARDALVKQARVAKDRPLAEALKKLRRPTVGAWYLNVAVRDGLTSLRELLKLGVELRAAQAAHDFKKVVALGPRRADVERRVLADLAAHLRTLGVTASPAALEEVRSTLRAALTDAEAAAAVESGRLDRPLEYGAFGGFGEASASAQAEPEASERTEPEASERTEPEASGPEPAASSAPGEPTADDELAELERQAAEAAAALAKAREKRERAARERAIGEAEAAVAAAEAQAKEARAEHDRLAAELGAAAERLAIAEDALATAEAALARLAP